MRSAYILPLLLFAAFIALAETGCLAPSAATQQASTRPVLAGRDTPEGAMNVYRLALMDGDIATVADSYNFPKEIRDATAQELIADVQFYAALEKTFGQSDALYICEECGIKNPSISRHYLATDWDYPRNEPGVARGKIISGGRTPSMQRGLDGIWRIGPIRVIPARSGIATSTHTNGLAARANELQTIKANLLAHKYSTADQVIEAIRPGWSPAMSRRAQLDEENRREQIDEDIFLATKFDPSTLSGAISTFEQARHKIDVTAMSRFFYAANDPDRKLARSNAERIATARQLDEAVCDRIGSPVGSVIVRQSPRITLEFPDLYHASDFPELLHADEPANGNEATVTAMDGTLVKFVKVDGVWKCDVTPSIPLDTAYFQAATKKNALVQQLTAEINSGKYTSYQEVEEAIEAVLPRSHGELVPGAFGGFR